MIEWVLSRTGRPLTVALVREGRAKERCFVERLVRSVAEPCGAPLTLVLHLTERLPSGDGALCSHFISSTAERSTL